MRLIAFDERRDVGPGVPSGRLEHRSYLFCASAPPSCTWCVGVQEASEVDEEVVWHRNDRFHPGLHERHCSVHFAVCWWLALEHHTTHIFLCLSVCNALNFIKPWPEKFIFDMKVTLTIIQVIFVYEGQGQGHGSKEACRCVLFVCGLALIDGRSCLWNVNIIVLQMGHSTHHRSRLTTYNCSSSHSSRCIVVRRQYISIINIIILITSVMTLPPIILHSSSSSSSIFTTYNNNNNNYNNNNYNSNNNSTCSSSNIIIIITLAIISSSHHRHRRHHRHRHCRQRTLRSLVITSSSSSVYRTASLLTCRRRRQRHQLTWWCKGMMSSLRCSSISLFHVREMSFQN